MQRAFRDQRRTVAFINADRIVTYVYLLRRGPGGEHHASTLP